MDVANITAEFELNAPEHFDCSFEIYASGTVWGSIDGDINNQTDLINILNGKADISYVDNTITDLAGTVTDNYNTLSGEISALSTTVDNNYTSLDNRLTTAEQGVLDLTDTVNDNYTELNGKITVNTDDIATIQNTINSYGDIVTYDAADFATKNQGLLAESALQPNDNITELVNNAGYITAASLPTVNNNTITIQKNGTNIDSFTLNQNTNKSINITVPTNTNELTNGAGFITSAVNNLTNYYLKSETYTKTEVQQLIASIPQFSVEVVQSLPVTGERMVLYLVPKQGEQPDVYDEYIWVEDENEFELLGSTAVDLTGYATETYVDNGLATKVSKSGDNLTGTLTTNSAIYLTNISSSVHTSVSRIYFGSVSSPTNYISANGAGAFGIYNNARQGITCYPTQNLFPDATSGTIDLGRSNNKWKNLYISGTLYGANTNISITDLISGATAGNTAVQPADLPVVNDATITFTQGGTTKGTITLNQSNNQTISLDAGGGGAVDSVNGQTGTVVLTASDIGALPDSTTIPTMTSQLTNDSGFITNSALNGYATQSWVGQQGYITGITSSDVTTALGYTPYNATNPNGYTSNVGTVTSVNNTQPDSNGNVTITIPDTATWGNISGTLSDQTDLQNALNAKLNVSDVTEYTAAEVETLWGSI